MNAGAGNDVTHPAIAVGGRVQVKVTGKVSNIRSQTNGWYEGLKKQANIVDERSKHF
jgi:hypothetical protein